MKFEMCVLFQISFATILPNSFKIGNNAQSNRKNEKGVRFLKHSVRMQFTTRQDIL